MFNWRKKLLTSLDLKKQEKLLKKNKPVEVSTLISKRLFDINKDTGSYIDGTHTIDDRPFTAVDRSDKKFHKKQAEQIKNKRPVEIQLPSTAIKSARFDENKGAIYVTYVGGDKEYVFKGDRATWLNFMNAGSKGRFCAYVLKPYHQAPRSWYS